MHSGLNCNLQATKLNSLLSKACLVSASDRNSQDKTPWIARARHAARETWERMVRLVMREWTALEQPLAE